MSAPEHLYLTYDIGTTALKTALFDDAGRMLAIYSHEYTFHSPRSGWSQVDAGVFWDAAVVGTRRVLARVGVDPSSISAIGLSSQGQTFVPVDANGNTLYDAIVWLDKRAQAVADCWGLDRDEFRKSTGYTWIPSELTIFKIAWLLEHVPSVRKTWKYLCIPDYLTYKLTGEAATDTTIATMTGAFDLRARRWNAKLLDLAGIDEDQLPEVLHPASIAGHLLSGPASELGLPAGVPVCVGSNDQIVGAVGAGNVRTGIVGETTGTSLAVVASTNELLDTDRACVGLHAAECLFYAMQFTNTSAIVLKWFRDLCTSGEPYDIFLSGVESIAPGCDGLTVLPHFSGTQADPGARGALIGLTLSHTRQHISLAIMESCCFMLRDCVETFDEAGIRSESIRSMGGAARSDVWLQMKADVLGVVVERPACSDSASLGAAMLAAVGAGRFASVADASQRWYTQDTVFEPNSTSHKVFNEVYERYKELRNTLGW